ncbi:hypothetical protein P3339_09185 [Microbulbifer sp. MLAF003]|uniref:hypothetical protein n=1 Tax=Microbulbifer sp. MLAF003 TaxID=3032582 RepID=UPI0024AE6C05|nr:hypothetical protein [Microbulbifer sp. MLAF003]WHI52914.1 hypothetical protein P3339_09185 [Microbulbifer sp. MLAF003]
MTPGAIESTAGDALPGSATDEVIDNGHSTDTIVHTAITQATELTISNAQAAAVLKILDCLNR